MWARDAKHAEWLLQIGSKAIVDSVEIPSEWQIDDIVTSIYGEDIKNDSNLSKKVILAGYNDDAMMLTI